MNKLYYVFLFSLPFNFEDITASLGRHDSELRLSILAYKNSLEFGDTSLSSSEIKAKKLEKVLKKRGYKAEVQVAFGSRWDIEVFSQAVQKDCEDHIFLFQELLSSEIKKNIAIPRQNGKTIFDIAIEKKNKQVVEFLLKLVTPHLHFCYLNVCSINDAEDYILPHRKSDAIGEGVSRKLTLFDEAIQSCDKKGIISFLNFLAPHTVFGSVVLSNSENEKFILDYRNIRFSSFDKKNFRKKSKIPRRGDIHKERVFFSFSQHNHHSIYSLQLNNKNPGKNLKNFNQKCFPQRVKYLLKNRNIDTFLSFLLSTRSSEKSQLPSLK